MTDMKRFLVLGLSAAFAGFAAVGAHGQTPGACQPFTVISDGSEFSVEYLDIHTEGPGPGDMRVGRRGLVDEDGNAAGSYRWILRSLDAPPGSGERSEVYQNHAMTLNDGELHFQSLAEAVRSADGTDRVSVGDYTGIVIGGTGAYMFARGTVDASFDGKQVTYAFNIRCD